MLPCFRSAIDHTGRQNVVRDVILFTLDFNTLPEMRN